MDRAENKEGSPIDAVVATEQLTPSEQTQSCSLQKPRGYKEPLPLQDSDIGLEWLKLNGGNSNVLINKMENISNAGNISDEKKLRVALYEAPVPSKAIVEESKVNLLSPIEYHAKVEESKIEILAPLAMQATVEEPKTELLSPEAQQAMVEEVRLGIIKCLNKNDDDIIIISDDNEQDNEIKDEKNENSNEANESHTDNVASVPTTDSCQRKMLERETQTGQSSKLSNRPRLTRVSITHMPGTKSSVCVAGTSSDNCSSEQPRKLKINTQNQSTFKQRQLELHRHRISVEQKRMELLELKIARERDEMLREAILFEKEIEIKNVQIRKINEDRVDI